MGPYEGPLDGSVFGPESACYGCGPTHATGFRLSFDRQDDGVVTHFTPEDHQQGPPGIMHGGLVMTLADEIAAWAVIEHTGHFGFTGAIDARLKLPVRIGVETVGRARVTRNLRRLAEVEVEIDQGGRRCFEGKLRFVMLDEKAAEELLGQELPAAWRRFGR